MKLHWALYGHGCMCNGTWVILKLLVCVLATVNLLVLVHPVFILFLVQIALRWFGARCALNAYLGLKECHAVKVQGSAEWFPHGQFCAVCSGSSLRWQSLCVDLLQAVTQKPLWELKVPGWGLRVLVCGTGHSGMEGKQLQKQKSCWSLDF